MTKAVWVPSGERLEGSRMFQWMQSLGYDNYDALHAASIKDIDWFWGEVEKAVGVEWFTHYEKTVDVTRGIQWAEWFTGGRLNAAYNALEKWCKDEGSACRQAIIWERETGEKKTYTYKELAKCVDRVAAGLKKQGIQRGDRVGIYMPMIPEMVIAVLALTKIGAIFTASYSGFAADPVAKRLESAQAKMVITADGHYRRGTVIPMKIEADKAADAVNSVEKMVVVRNAGIDIPWNSSRDIDWSELEVDGTCEYEEMGSMDPFMIAYTSGTTGKPKGTVHTHGSFPIRAAFDMGFASDLEPGEALYWVTDIGWIVGPIVVYGTLINGSTLVLYEGAPAYPGPDRLWKMVDEHKISILGVSPTLTRSLMSLGNEHLQGYDLSSLKSFTSTGEPWDPSSWNWLFETVGKSRIPIINVSGGTEIGGGILSNSLNKPIAPAAFNGPQLGMDADVYNINGQPIRNQTGELIIKQPWLGMTYGFWQDPERYLETYWDVWEDIWVHGDAVQRDDEGYWVIIGRSDDTLNVSGKRMGPAEIESVLNDHPAIMESAVIGEPDPMKGEVPVCFAILNETAEPTEELKVELMEMMIEKLGKSQKPREIYFVTDLPRTRSGKIMRRIIKSVSTGLELGDLSGLDNPEAIEAVRKGYLKQVNK
ncbi:MAG TPA: AMP-binding protein [Chondromyces sp.]|nr:AMP-binding protein [Chondromyces sp.]